MGSSCEKGTYVIFDGVFDWTRPWHGMYESNIISAKEGDKINSWLTCDTDQCTQYIQNTRTGEDATYPYKLHNPSKNKEAVLYFVLDTSPLLAMHSLQTVCAPLKISMWRLKVRLSRLHGKPCRKGQHAEAR